MSELYGKYQITAEERLRRLKAIDYGIATVELEGLMVSDEAKAIYQKFIGGDLTADEMTKSILA